MPETKIKGLWMPYEILTNEKLSDKEKIIYSLILFFSKNEGYCTITNRYIANIVQLSEARVSKLISSLSKQEYINVVTNFEDKNRQIIIRKIIPLKKYEETKTTTPIVKNDHRNSQKNIIAMVKNDKYIKNNKNKKINNNQRVYDSEFFKTLYANKIG